MHSVEYYLLSGVLLTQWSTTSGCEGPGVVILWESAPQASSPSVGQQAGVWPPDQEENFFNEKCLKASSRLPRMRAFQAAMPHDIRQARMRDDIIFPVSSQGRVPLTGIIPDLDGGIVC